MNIEDFREYCLSLKGATEETPFGPDWLTYKVGGKIFALTYLKSPVFKANLKHLPEKSVELREIYPAIEPGYHMNKKHWNTVNFEGGLSDDFLTELINHSYELVFKKLSKMKQDEIKS